MPTEQLMERVDRAVSGLEHKFTDFGERLAAVEALARQQEEELTRLASEAARPRGAGQDLQHQIRSLAAEVCEHLRLRGHISRRLDIAPGDMFRRAVLDLGDFSTAKPKEQMGIAATAPVAVQRVTDFIPRIPTSQSVVEFVRLAMAASSWSPQVETLAKPEATSTPTPVQVTVQTLAAVHHTSAQALEDVEGLSGILSTTLAELLRDKEETQVVAGDGTGTNLSGLTAQATEFDTNLLSDSWNYADVIARAIQQITAAKAPQPDIVIVSPAAYWTLRLLRETGVGYVMGPPNADGSIARLWGLRVVSSTALSDTEFLVGSTRPNVLAIRERSGIDIAASTEHSDNFIKNIVTLRAEIRECLCVYQPAAWVYGTFSTSP